MRYRVARGLAFVICLSLLAWEWYSSNPQPVVLYATPEACFTAAKSAIAANDYARYCRCLTPSSQVAMSAGLILAAVRAKGQLDAGIATEGDLPAFAPVKKMVEAMFDAMDRQGIDQTKLPRPDEVKDFKRGSGPIDIRFVQAALEVPDHPTLIVECFRAIGDDNDFQAKILERFDGSIENLKIEGEVASASFIRPPGSTLPNKFLHFKKLHGNWLIQMNN